MLFRSLAVALSVVFWFAVYFQPRLQLSGNISSIFLYMVFVNLWLFFSSIATSPPFSRATVVLAFIFSVSICFSAGGYGDARRQREGRNVLRDDYVVRIERVDGKLIATPSEIPLLTSWPGILKRLLG